MLLEIACFNLQSCYIAESAGADRIEFCHDYDIGGITPAHKDIAELSVRIRIPFHVIIRPRGGNFIYDSAELEQMKRDILFCREKKVQGVVFGILKNNNTVDESACAELLELAKPMHCTFHRAIDSCEDLFASTEILIRLGFDSVLTSGKKENAFEGTEILKKLQRKYGAKINIIAGGSVRSENIDEIHRISGCTTFHSSALRDGWGTASAEEIYKIKKIIHSL
jgi:copper homeostasis protein